MPLPLIVPWAAEANYPAGANPWNGNPTKVTPSGDVFIPNTKPPAQWFNFLFSQRDGWALALLQALASIAAKNWSPNFTFAGESSGPYAITWNDAPMGTGSGQTWLLSGFTSGTAKAEVISIDGMGLTSSVIGGGEFGTAHPPTSMVADPATSNVFVTVIGVTGSTALAVISLAGGAWSTPTGTAATSVTDIQLAMLGSTCIYGIAAATGQGSVGVLSTGAAFTAGASGLTFGSSGLIVKASGTLAVVVDRGVASATLRKSPDGVTWTSVSLGTAIAAALTVQDITWNASLGLWLLCGVNAGVTQIWTSPDAATWTMVGSLGSTGISRVRSLGPMFVAVTSATPGRALFSFDGATWWGTQGLIQGGGSTFNAIHASPTQLLLAAALPASVGAGGDNFYRLSTDIGFPSSHL